MKISAKIQYACLAIIELALHWPSEVPVQISTIAQRQRIPLKFLTQIMIMLKQGGYVESSRGKNGGYILAKAPGSIRLSEIVRAFGGLGEGHLPSGRFPGEKILNHLWNDMDEALIKQLGKFTFEEISQAVRQENAVITFTI